MDAEQSDAPEISIRNLDELTGYFEASRTRLEKIVRFRMDPAFQARMDPGDVLQESYMEIVRRFHEFQQSQPIHPMVWIRQRVLQTLWDMQRNHGRAKRTVFRETVSPERIDGNTTSLSIVRLLMDDRTSPSQAVVKDEERERMLIALNGMNEIDREILAMRHFEYLTNLETARVLGITPTAASNRYVRAVERLAEILRGERPGS